MRTGVPRKVLIAALVCLLAGLPGMPAANAQAPVAGDSPPPAPLAAAQLEELVGRIALYPDDLVAIILPAATFPLDIVQADRFLQKLKQDKTLKPDDRWDESIRDLLNYPEVVSMMSGDLDWTQDLGEAVVAQQGDVLKAVQAFRAKAASAGNLKSDDKQLIVQENNTIQIVPADPEVIYVPQYQPSTVVVQQAAPVYGYYPAPYPSYYYPYPAGYAFAGFATGLAFGAATAWACNWGGGNIENNVNINNTSNFNTNRTNVQNQQKVNQARQQGQQRAQQGQQRPGGQGGAQAGAGARGQGGASTWQSQKKPGDVSQGRSSRQTAQARPGSSASGGASRGDSFGGGGRGSDAARDSSRGAESRGGASASTIDRGGGGGSRGGASASTMDRGGSSSRGGSSGFSGGSSSGSRGGSSGGFSGGSSGGSRGGGGGGGSRGGGGGGGRGGGGRR
jgi:hypothetical protein